MARAGIRGSRYHGISPERGCSARSGQKTGEKGGRERRENGGVEREGKTGASHRQLYFGREKRAVHKNMKKVRRRARTYVYARVGKPEGRRGRGAAAERTELNEEK